MAELVVCCPGEADRVVSLGKEPVVVGREEGCDLWIAEKKASRRHLRIAAAEGGGFLAEDLDSANGTMLSQPGLGEARIARRVLAHGDTLRIGDTTLRLREAAPPAGLVGGTLDLRPVGRTGAPEIEYGGGESSPGAALGEDSPSPYSDAEPALESRPARPIDHRALLRAVAFVLVALGIVFGVETWLGAKAEKGRTEAAAHVRARDILANADLDYPTFEGQVREFAARYYFTPERVVLEGYLERAKIRDAARQKADADLNDLSNRGGSVPESEVRARLLALGRRLPDDKNLAVRIKIFWDSLDKSRAEGDAETVGALVEESFLAAQRGNPGGALRRLIAYESSHPGLAPEDQAKIAEARQRATAAVKDLAQKTLEAAELEKDPEKRRALLAAAWPGLAGTSFHEALADALKFSSSSSAAPGKPTSPGSPGTDTPPPVPQDVLDRASAAERLVASRRWAEAKKSFADLIAQGRRGALLDEWVVRAEEVDRILALVAALGEAAKAEKPPRVRIAAGTVTVTAADGAGVTWRLLNGETKTAWRDAAPDDLLAFLAPAHPTADQRIALALVAADVSRREALLGFLAPIYEKEKDHGAADRLVARHLYGRAAPPDGGYQLYKGELLDAAGYARRVDAEHLASLRAEALGLVDTVAKDSVFKKLSRLKELRDELDKRRKYALLAIFNEKHYPYPHNNDVHYNAVQAEIDRRIALVREIWDDDKTKAKVARAGTLGPALEKWDALLLEIRSKGQSTTDLDQAMAPYLIYATGEAIGIRDFFRNASERGLFDYNRWVMETYNPAHTAVAATPEVEQTRITNEYRMMLGFTVIVEPGPAGYDSIDGDNVVKVLDEGRIVDTSVTPLGAVRIDDRLVNSARGHSKDMEKRGYFLHQAPANPATGAPSTSPFDRMNAAGYRGHGASENIAGNGGGPMGAHVAWCHSSGHHRNILSAWQDQGVGQAGNLWTQNFGTGGGKPARIEPADGAEPPGGPGKPRRGR